MVLSLLELCARHVGKRSSLSHLQTVLSYQLTKRAINFILANLPIHKALALEKLFESCSNFDLYWEQLITKCKRRNYIFQAKLQRSDDPFESETLEEQNYAEAWYSRRQILLNNLFLEALDRFCHICENKIKGMPSFPLHEALLENYTDITDYDWLIVLSTEINCFNFYPRHAKIIFHDRILLDNISKHATSVHLRLDLTLSYNPVLFLVFYKVFHYILSAQCVKRVSVYKVYSTANYIALLQLCFGIVDRVKLNKELHQLQQEGSSPTDYDIWDNALGEGDGISEKEVDFSDTFYCDFVQNCNRNDILLHKKSFICQLEAIAELNLDLEGADVGNFEIEMLVACLSNASSINKLAISSSTMTLGEENNFIEMLLLKTIEQFIMNANSKLKVLKLSNFEIPTERFCGICAALCSIYEKRKAPFEMLAFANCFFSGCTSCDIVSCDETILRTLCTEKAVFESLKSYANYTKCLRVLNPHKYLILDHCRTRKTEFAINLKMLLDALQNTNSLKSCSINSIIFTLTLHENEERLEHEFTEALSARALETFTLVHHPNYVMIPGIIDVIEHHAKKVVICKKSFDETTPVHSIDDFVSQM